MIRFNQHFKATQNTENTIELLPSFPNPFVEMTLLRFNLPNASQVILRIFNAEGTEVGQKKGAFAGGENQLMLQRQDLQEPGIYEYEIETSGETSNRRKLVMF